MAVIELVLEPVNEEAVRQEGVEGGCRSRRGRGGHCGRVRRETTAPTRRPPMRLRQPTPAPSRPKRARLPRRRPRRPSRRPPTRSPSSRTRGAQPLQLHPRDPRAVTARGSSPSRRAAIRQLVRPAVHNRGLGVSLHREAGASLGPSSPRRGLGFFLRHGGATEERHRPSRPHRARHPRSGWEHRARVARGFVDLLDPADHAALGERALEHRRGDHRLRQRHRGTAEHRVPSARRDPRESQPRGGRSSSRRSRTRCVSAP